MREFGLVIAFLFLMGMITLTTTIRAENLHQDGLNNLNLDSFTIEGENLLSSEELFSLRQLAEQYNLILTYRPNDKTVLISNGSRRSELDIDQGRFNGEKLNRAPIISDGRTYLDVEAVGLIVRSLVPEEGAELLTTLSTRKKGDKLIARIKAFNISDGKITLNFSSGQSYDLYLFKDGQEVWRWSEGKFFTMAIVSRELKPGGELSYEVELPTGELKPGRYTLTGELTTMNPLQLGEVEVIID